MKDDTIGTYLKNRSITGPWHIEGCGEAGFAGAVVIPSLAEFENLFTTLASLAANPADILVRFLVLVVVNHREDASLADKKNNYLTLTRLKTGSPDLYPLRLAWVDAASPGLEMPVKGGGVGLARKIGLDLALNRLDNSSSRSVLVCLDADTLVEPSYLSALDRHFRGTTAGGATIAFRHRLGRSPEEQHAIDRYELFLRHYIVGLRITGSPYAFHTVGSAMACSIEAYVKAGGMNNREAGEDFYFLQHLFRTSGVAQVQGTVVRPSPRPSHRVPFGTGRSVFRWLGGDERAITFYRPECFRILGNWLAIVGKGLERGPDEIICEAETVSVHLADFLEDARFAETWARLRRNHRTPDRLLRGFHEWFDGLKTMKLIHHLSAREFPRCGPEEAIPGLLSMVGVESAENPGAQLATLRKIEDGD